jgi:type I restriction enzyme R subunit
MNFEFLNNRRVFSQLHSLCCEAEKYVVAMPEVSALKSRSALESMVKIFYTAKYGDYDRSARLFDLVQNAQFSNFMDDSMMSTIHLIRKIGNNAAHSQPVTKAHAMAALEALYYFTHEMMHFFGTYEEYPRFNRADYAVTEKPTEEVAQANEEEIVVDKEEVKECQVNTTETKLKSAVDFNEDETRKIYIDTALQEAGWEFSKAKGRGAHGKVGTEIVVRGMPDGKDGRADYVLFDEDGLPLAVIEAKRTSKSEEEGAAQAKAYADCLQRMYGCARPVVFYTNGYKVMMEDGRCYPARRVYGYYSKDELHSLIVRRNLKKIEDDKIKPEISDRYFIQEACTAVCESLNEMHRKQLIVMATGTGKTRCTVGLVDILQRNDWVKNVLFLADRKELVKQAKGDFVKYMPDATICAISEETKDKRDYNANIILSTYNTILNLIDSDKKTYGIGRFDLIVSDECHRTIYNKYRAIFRYFDSLMLGLTATPREQVNLTTYDLFDLPHGVPTYNYDFEKAVKEGYLVNFRAKNRTTRLLQSGLKYDDLTEEEKEEFELTFVDDDGNIPDWVAGANFLNNILNRDTIDAMLHTLMKEGLRIKGGEELGKTIIFAQKHEVAERIVSRFKELYPKYGDDYCKVIDYKTPMADVAIDDFKGADKMPRIAVSVAMLDTGIDVPEVLNLVFYKRVMSKIMFWQMIGRGTRKCEDLNVFSPSSDYFLEKSEDATFASHKDKQGFFIFDFCGNFDYFGMSSDGKEGRKGRTLTQEIYVTKAEMICELQAFKHQEIAEHKAYYEELRNDWMSRVRELKRSKVNVHYNLKYVDKYSEEKTWEYISAIDYRELISEVVPLLESVGGDESAKRFDLCVYRIEAAFLEGNKNYNKLIKRVVDICNALLEKSTLKEIRENVARLKYYISDEFWNAQSITSLESLRNEIRGLVHYIYDETTEFRYTNFTDEVVELEDQQGIVPSFKDYRTRVEEYLARHTNTGVIMKIKSLIPLTAADVEELQRLLWQELGSREEYDAVAKGKSLGAFVRKIVGLDQMAINELFGQYLRDYHFNAKQQEFLNLIVGYVRENGDIEAEDLINEMPFKQIEYMDYFEDTNVVYRLIYRLHKAIEGRNVVVYKQAYYPVSMVAEGN